MRYQVQRNVTDHTNVEESGTSSTKHVWYHSNRNTPSRHSGFQAFALLKMRQISKLFQKAGKRESLMNK